MQTGSNFMYYGKGIPSSCATFLMALEFPVELSSRIYPYLSTEIFNYQCIIEDSKKWFCSYPHGIDALTSCEKNLGIENLMNIKNIFFEDINSFRQQIEDEINRGRFILGPICSSPIWSNVESRFYHGDSHFVYVSGIKDNVFHLQEPTGCPDLCISINTFYELVRGLSDFYCVQVKFNASKHLSMEDVQLNILTNAVDGRQKLITSEFNFLKSMGKLQDRLIHEKVKSLEKLSFIYVVRHLRYSIYLSYQFLVGNIISAYVSKKCLLEKWITLLNSYLTTLSVESAALSIDFSGAVKRIFSLMIVYESAIDDVMNEIKFLK
jgi:hypothetical protein